jgi:hypothetical protein
MLLEINDSGWIDGVHIPIAWLPGPDASFEQIKELP